MGGISSIWSPIVAMYLVARDVSKEKFIGTTGFLFLAGVLPLGAGQLVAGILTFPVLIKSALALCVVLVGFRIGEVLRDRVSQELFRKAVLMLTRRASRSDRVAEFSLMGLWVIRARCALCQAL